MAEEEPGGGAFAVGLFPQREARRETGTLRLEQVFNVSEGDYAPVAVGAPAFTSRRK